MRRSDALTIPRYCPEYEEWLDPWYCNRANGWYGHEGHGVLGAHASRQLAKELEHD